jgi:hypothetical protein
MRGRPTAVTGSVGPHQFLDRRPGAAHELPPKGTFPSVLDDDSLPNSSAGSFERNAIGRKMIAGLSSGNYFIGRYP